MDKHIRYISKHEADEGCEVVFERDYATIIACALGELPADLVIKNIALINVCTHEILESEDIAIKQNRIVRIGNVSDIISEKTHVLDGKNLFAAPGFIESHIHLESSMVAPSQFAQAVLPHGTTTVIIDPHEIANVLGLLGIETLLAAAAQLPLKLLVAIPSCVPAAPGLETSGAELGVEEIEKMLQSIPEVVALGEMMNFTGVLSRSKEVLKKIQATHETRKPVEGHAPGLRGEKLDAYLASGISSDHESVSGEEGLEKLRKGMKLMLREGSLTKNLRELLKPILETGLNLNNCMIVSDDRLPGDLVGEGHLDHAMRIAIREGLDPVSAIKLVTINPATHFRLQDDLGTVSPGKIADIVLLSNLENITINKVITNGMLVVADGKALFSPKVFDFPTPTTNTIHLAHPPVLADFAINMPAEWEENMVHVRVIKAIDGSIFTEANATKLQVSNGLVQLNPAEDILQISVLERHKATGNIGTGLVSGFGLKEGAIASTIAHDAHNLVIVGASRKEMVLAARQVAKMQGGITIARKNQILASLPLPIAGLMTERPVQEVNDKLDKLHKLVRAMGTELEHPFLTLGFLSLSVAPELKITDKGLVDVNKFELVSLFI
ncbi:MAG: adenine deaminase [Candidatus Hodarchaeota archaeon]